MNNLRPLITLSQREIMRFLKVYHQTIIAPTVTALLFLLIFYFVMNRHVNLIGTTPFLNFIASGLVMMTIIQNSFANTSSVLVMGKVTGTMIDYLMPPFSTFELVGGLIIGAVTRGLMVAVVLIISLMFVVKFEFHNFGIIISYIILASILFGLVGIIGGLVSNSFDQISALTSYFITPLAFLSGTFYSVEHLPEAFKIIAHINPFFYLIDGFRYGMTGYCEGSLVTGLSYIIILVIIFFAAIYQILRKGWRIKA